MKCPKCSYLGFETGDTCKNCGYDFSLLADIDSEPVDEPIDVDLDLRTVESELTQETSWPEAADAMLSDIEPVLRIDDDLVEPVVDEPARLAAVPATPEPPLPLFTPTFGVDDDEPLIKLPATPRPPLAVRRTPDTPRLRMVPKPTRSAEPAPVLAFEEPDLDPEPEPVGRDLAPAGDAPHRMSRVWAAPHDGAITEPGVRLAAAAVDHLLLGGVDVVVVYFTTRVAGLAMGDWSMLPPAPLIAFLLMLKLSYFAAFTAVGGQTIGKMALGLRVVGADRAPIDTALACKRTLVGAVSGLAFGLGYLPAFFDSERRTLHDRVAHTRVVSSRTA